MGPAARAVLDLHVPCDRGAPARVRRALERLDAIGWVAGDLMLVASELVTNAVLHSGCWPGDLLRVRVERTDDHFVVSVQDPGRSGESAAVPIDDEGAFGGVGLWVVEQLVPMWGAERNDGYRVWAELPAPAAVE
jgi:anti-sigma regulatory factor (Ser/Thr protein kinase)